MTEVVLGNIVEQQDEISIDSITYRINLSKLAITQLLGLDFFYSNPDETITSLEKYRLEEEKNTHNFFA